MGGGDTGGGLGHIAAPRVPSSCRAACRGGCCQLDVPDTALVCIALRAAPAPPGAGYGHRARLAAPAASYRALLLLLRVLPSHLSGPETSTCSAGLGEARGPPLCAAQGRGKGSLGLPAPCAHGGKGLVDGAGGLGRGPEDPVWRPGAPCAQPDVNRAPPFGDQYNICDTLAVPYPPVAPGTHRGQVRGWGPRGTRWDGQDPLGTPQTP